uniref:Uncharacterized protein n=1 Tax=Romanomermis culicivorax TaxID=13658 RepID=A0A915KMC7_ROMCU
MTDASKTKGVNFRGSCDGHYRNLRCSDGICDDLAMGMTKNILWKKIFACVYFSTVNCASKEQIESCLVFENFAVQLYHFSSENKIIAIGACANI